MREGDVFDRVQTITGKDERAPSVVKRQPRDHLLWFTTVIYLAWVAVTPFLPGRTSEPPASQPGIEWSGDSILVLLAVFVTLNLLRREFGRRDAIKAITVIAAGSTLATLISVKTGFPFGWFLYTERLGSQLISGLPWVVPAGWLLLVLNAYLICSAIFAEFRLENPRDADLLVVIISSLVVALMALVIEPVASNVRLYWFWLETDRAYYGAPRLNFVGWLTTTSVLLAVLTCVIEAPRVRLSTAWISLGLLGSFLLLVALLSWGTGFYTPVFIALNLMGGLAIGLVWASQRRIASPWR